MKGIVSLHPFRYSAVICLTMLMCFRPAGGGQGFAEEYATSRAVYVASNGFHTGLIVEMDDETRPMLVFAEHFPKYRYVDIGWGNEEFYQDPNPTIGMGARAILLPTSSVVRVEGLNADPADVANWSSHAVRIVLKGKEFTRLCEYINGSFSKGPSGGLIEASRHGGGSVIFFKSPYKYHLFNTCNTWIARAFQFAGCDISPTSVITARSLFRRLDRIGETMR